MVRMNDLCAKETTKHDISEFRGTAALKLESTKLSSEPYVRNSLFVMAGNTPLGDIYSQD